MANQTTTDKSKLAAPLLADWVFETLYPFRRKDLLQDLYPMPWSEAQAGQPEPSEMNLIQPIQPDNGQRELIPTPLPAPTDESQGSLASGMVPIRTDNAESGNGPGWLDRYPAAAQSLAPAEDPIKVLHDWGLTLPGDTAMQEAFGTSPQSDQDRGSEGMRKLLTRLGSNATGQTGPVQADAAQNARDLSGYKKQNIGGEIPAPILPNTTKDKIWDFVRESLDPVVGIGEGAASLATGALSNLAGMVSGFKYPLDQFVSQRRINQEGLADARKWQNGMTEAYTYQPRSRFGNTITSVAGAPIAAAHELIDRSFDDEKNRDTAKYILDAVLWMLPSIKGVKAKISESLPRAARWSEYTGDAGDVTSLKETRYPLEEQIPDVQDIGHAEGIRSPKETIEVKGNELGKYTDIRDLWDKARTYARQHFAGKTIYNQDTGFDIIIPWQGIKHSFAGKIDKWKALSVVTLPEMIEAGKLVKVEPDYRGRENINVIYRFNTQLEIDGTPFTAHIVVREHPDGKRFYDHKMSKIEKAAGISGDSLSGD